MILCSKLCSLKYYYRRDRNMNKSYIVIDTYYGTVAMRPTTSRQQAYAFAERQSEQNGRHFEVEVVYE
tara:strand:+ start:26 stop:229 length:204 start_codon:yes stop_codon:yes gene_type:complete